MGLRSSNGRGCHTTSALSRGQPVHAINGRNGGWASKQPQTQPHEMLKEPDIFTIAAHPQAGLMNFRYLTSPDLFCMCIVGWSDQFSPFFP